MNNILPMPTVIEKTPSGEKYYDITSKHFEHRNVFLVGQVNEASATSVILQLLYLDSVDSKTPINLYICSPGGSVDHGLGILDTMLLIKAPLNIIGVASCASMGAVLLSVKKPDGLSRRKALKNCRIMVHQVSGGVQGQASDVIISAKQAVLLNNKLHDYLCEFSGNTMEDMKVMMDRDYYMSAEEALAKGFIDEVL